MFMMNSRPNNRERTYNEAYRNPIEEYEDEQFLIEFRMTKEEVRMLCDLLREDLKCRGNRKCDLSVEHKVLISLKTLASGSFQHSAKDFLRVSQPVVSRTLEAFANALIKKASHFIYMPRNNDEKEATKSKFYGAANFPGVLGCIDGSHIPIIAPSVDEPMYVNRKKFHSINIQAVCDADAVFLDVVAKHPGSFHDSFILQSSGLHDRFERGEFGDGWLLGDSGYALKSWLLTPILNPVGNREKSYNKKHKKTRSLIERAFGILKSRWRIIDHTGGRLCYTPLKVCKLIYVCCILHNICRRNGTPLLGDNRETPQEIIIETEATGPTTSGERQRARVIGLIASNAN